MRQFIVGLLYDNDKPSRTGFIGVMGFFLCMLAAFAVTVYIVVKGAKFEGYDSFLQWCRDIGIGSGAVQTANKAINTFGAKEEQK
jgi:hypothetical protein